jgi:hypothetical protein
MSGARGWIVFALAAALGGCDVSSGGPPGKVGPGAPTATPTSAPVRLSPPSLAFASPGAPAQTVTIAETGYAATFTVDATACTRIVTVVLAPSTQSFTVTPSAAGSCTLVVRDTQGNASNLPVTVSP